MADPVVIRLDLQERYHQALSPFLVERIRDYAATQPEVGAPADFAGKLLGRLYAGDPSLVCFALVDPTSGHCLGHTLAAIERLGTSIWTNVFQPPDKALGAGRFALLDAVVGWSYQAGVPRIVVVSERPRDKALLERYKARPFRHLMEIQLGTPAAPDPQSQSDLPA